MRKPKYYFNQLILNDMPEHALLTYIKKYITLSEDEWELLRARLVRETYTEGDVLLAEGKVCKHLYFLESGLMRYYVTKDGEELNKFFTKPPYLFTSQQSFGLGTPALETVHSTSKCNREPRLNVRSGRRCSI